MAQSYGRLKFLATCDNTILFDLQILKIKFVVVARSDRTNKRRV
jgi:hypothetical protein